MKSLFVKAVIAAATLTAAGAVLRSISYAAATRREEPLYGPSELGIILAAAATIMVASFSISAWRRERRPHHGAGRSGEGAPVLSPPNATGSRLLPFRAPEPYHPVMRLNWKSLWILGVVALMLLVGYLLQGVADGGDGGSPDVPDSELTPAATTGVDVPNVDPTRRATIVSAILTIESETRTATPTLLGRDLAADEIRGGHTIARHVGRTDAQLRQRLEDEPDISAASTYPDLQTAQRVVQTVLDERRGEIEQWEDRSGSRPNLVLRLDLDEPVGRSIRQGQSRAQECEHAVVVLRWTNDGWYVLTSYPEDR